jgi:hypothetical protein
MADWHLGRLLSRRVLAGGADLISTIELQFGARHTAPDTGFIAAMAGNGSRKNGVHLRPATCGPALGVREVDQTASKPRPCFRA